MNREYTKKLESYLDIRDVTIFKKYKNLIYNVSGAKSVNCESSLDQENMIFDYSENDVRNKNVFLSEIEIFNRMFLEQVFTSLDRISPSLYLIDSLKYEDILHLRKVINNSNFIEKYNKLIHISSNVIKQNEFIDFYNLNELIEISSELHSQFKNEIESEIPSYMKKEYKNSTNQIFIESSFGFIKAFSGLSEPLFSNITGILDSTVNLIHLVKNKYNIIKNDSDNKIRQNYYNNKNEILMNIVNNSYIDNRSSMIDTLKLIQSYINSKQQI